MIRKAWKVQVLRHDRGPRPLNKSQVLKEGVASLSRSRGEKKKDKTRHGTDKLDFLVSFLLVSFFLFLVPERHDEVLDMILN